MGFRLSPLNIILFFSYVSPILLGFFMVMSSMFNQDIKGIIYLSGVLLFCLVIGGSLRLVLKQRVKDDREPICDMVDLPLNGNEYEAPIFSTTTIAFTMMYLFLPMLSTGFNIPVISSLIVLLVLDIIVNIYHKCGSVSSIFISTFFGVLFGSIWYYLMAIASDGKFTYFTDEPQNNVVCKKPEKKTYKCKVYKNGKLLKTL